MLDRIRKDLKRYGPAAVAAGLFLWLYGAFGGKICPLTRLCGIPCPGCGMTRAVRALMTGRWTLAWQMNPTIFPLLLWAVWAGLCRYVRGCPVYGRKICMVFVLLFMLGSYAVRMFLYFPDTEPYVYYEDNLLAVCLRGLSLLSGSICRLLRMGG